jgi:hypothetical protein
MKIGADHERRLGETLRDRTQSISEHQGFPCHPARVALPYP